jgi:hypothetical protein
MGTPEEFQECLALSALMLDCVVAIAIPHSFANMSQNLFVFLQDGSNDLNIYAGDWWKANETMEVH